MQRRARSRDDLERYIAERNAREPGFAALVADAEARLAFGRQMAERRRARGQTQTQVAALMQTSPAIVSRLESGHDVRVSTLEKYAAALGLRLELNAVPPNKPTTKPSRPQRAKPKAPRPRHAKPSASRPQHAKAKPSRPQRAKPKASRSRHAKK